MRILFGRLTSTLALIGWVTTFLMSGQSIAGETATEMLEKFHGGLETRYPSVSHISTSELEHLNLNDFILFDVRNPDEFDVSHIKGAIRVSPSASASSFLREHGDKIKNRPVILYCSVGERSSRLAASVAAYAQDNEAETIFNLTGGIFRWHNERRDVFDRFGKTSSVHPFNRWWGRLLLRSEEISTQPRAHSK